VAVSIETHEKTIYDMAVLLTSRPVVYGNSRGGQSALPYVEVNIIADVENGLPYIKYFDQELPGIDLEEQIARPIELTASVTFVGGNARGDLPAYRVRRFGIFYGTEA
jgi:hypothetical protein